ATFDWLVKRQNAIASDPLTFYSMLLFVLESAMFLIKIMGSILKSLHLQVILS
ncbi:hypothetical protein AAKU64_004458, partial [Undibacterium sp. GrIS 1.8]